MTIKLTLNNIRKNKPCEDCWEKLLKSLGRIKADDTEVTFSYIAENNNVSDSLWCLRCVDIKKYKKEISLLCAGIAESVLHIYEAKYPNDLRVRNCIQAIRDFTEGKISIEELEVSRRAAADAAGADAAAAADAAARAVYAAGAADTAIARADADARADARAADAAARAYASIAADAAARAADDAARAADDAESKKQVEMIKKYLG